MLFRSDADKEIERYCHVHMKEVLKPTGFQSSVANEWVKYDGACTGNTIYAIMARSRLLAQIGYQLICRRTLVQLSDTR